MRLPSADVATPWLASIPLISPTTLLVAGSMMWMLSPAELVWRMRSFPCCAAADEKDSAYRVIPAKAARPQRSTWLFVIVISHIQRHSLAASAARQARSSGDLLIDCYFCVAPDTNAFSVSQSGSDCEANC